MGVVLNGDEAQEAQSDGFGEFNPAGNIDVCESMRSARFCAGMVGTVD